MIHYRSQESAIPTETTGATDEDKKHLEHILSSKRGGERARQSGGAQHAGSFRSLCRLRTDG